MRPRREVTRPRFTRADCQPSRIGARSFTGSGPRRSQLRQRVRGDRFLRQVQQRATSAASTCSKLVRYRPIVLKKSEVSVHGKSAELPTAPSIDANPRCKSLCPRSFLQRYVSERSAVDIVIVAVRIDLVVLEGVDSAV